MNPELVVALATPTVIVSVIGWLLKRAIGQLDTQLAAVGGEVKAMGAAVAHRDVEVARLEGRIAAVERELFTRQRGA